MNGPLDDCKFQLPRESFVLNGELYRSLGGSKKKQLSREWDQTVHPVIVSVKLMECIMDICVGLN